MKISTNIPFHSYNTKLITEKKNPNRQTKFELVAFNSDKGIHSIRLDKGKTYNLGSINGKPFDLKLLQNGFEWSGRVKLSGRPEGKVTPEQKAAADAFASYTPQEWTHGEHIGVVISTITDIADNKLETSYFNKRIKLFGISQDEIESAIRYLSLDPHSPFTINGRTFTLKEGLLDDYDDKMLYKNKRRD